jgi:phage terminase large subunit GpA-like protein
MTAVLTARNNPALQELTWLARNCRAPKLRTHGEFFEQEMVVPTGPFENFKAKISRQPWTGHFLRELNSPRWNHCNLIAPGQAGKTFSGTAEPLLYHLFEQRETVVFGAPDEDTGADKWQVDYLPMILKTKYRELLPRRGEGSEGGRFHNMITFGNGARLKMMTGGGGDTSRSAFSSRVAVITEAGKLAVRSESSDETSKLQQIMSRVRSHDLNYRIYTECTLETPEGVMWQWHLTGSASRVVKPCPHCGLYVAPDEGDFVGWENAPDDFTAMELGHWACPECKEPITADQRREMNARGILVHRGQEVTPAGEVVGPEPRTMRFSFRAGAFDNQLVSPEGIAKELHDGSQESDQESAQKKIKQFLWALPWKSPLTEEILLEVKTLIQRQGGDAKGFVPAWCERLTVGVDLRKRQLHYVVIAWKDGFAGQVVDYNILSVRGDSLPIDEAIYEALLELRDTCEAGWAWQGKAAGELRIPDAVWYDSRYGQEGCYTFTRDPKTDRMRYRPLEGVGSGDYTGRTKYTRPKARTGNIKFIGDHYHRELRPAKRVQVVELDTDHWKNNVHQCLSLAKAVDGGIPLPGALVLFETKNAHDHLTLARHLTSERSQIEFEPGVGERKKWVRVGGENHYLDAANYATCAAYDVGIRPLGLADVPAEEEKEEAQQELITPSGQRFFVGDR